MVLRGAAKVAASAGDSKGFAAGHDMTGIYKPGVMAFLAVGEKPLGA